MQSLSFCCSLRFPTIIIKNRGINQRWKRNCGIHMSMDSVRVCGCFRCGKGNVSGPLDLSLFSNYEVPSRVFHPRPSSKEPYPISMEDVMDSDEFKVHAQTMLNKVHPPRAHWYEKFYAYGMQNFMKSYKEEVAGYKPKLFSHLNDENIKVLEMGVGTGSNFPYYPRNSNIRIIGVDPNKQMEKYAQASLESAGFEPSQFTFFQAVGEGLPLKDASLDVVVGTLVLCSVKDVNATLNEVMRVLKPGGSYIFLEHVGAKEGTALRFFQTVLDPLQQFIGDGCHLTRNTGKYISEAGFSKVNMDFAILSSIPIVGPHLYGVAFK